MQLLPRSAPPRLINVYVDFDGTIAPDEPTDQLFERFADPGWRAIDEAWLAGRMTSWDAIAQKVALLRASKEEIGEFLGTMRIDPDFPAFVDLCRRDDQRWADEDSVRSGANDDAACHGALLDQGADAFGWRQRAARGLVGHQLQRADQTNAPRLTHQRM